MKSLGEVLVYEGVDVLVENVAERFVAKIVAAQAVRGEATVVLTGGTLGIAVLAKVGVLVGCGVDWSKVNFWWGDERYVSGGSELRNDLQARQSFLDLVSVDPKRVHSFPSVECGLSVGVAAEFFAGYVKSVGLLDFPIDVLLLGMGADGHVASLFPGDEVALRSVDLVVGVEGSPKPPAQRLSFGFSVLNSAQEVWFVVGGADKAFAVSQALSLGGSVVPAGCVSGRERTLWFLDEGGASLL